MNRKKIKFLTIHSESNAQIEWIECSDWVNRMLSSFSWFFLGHMSCFPIKQCIFEKSLPEKRETALWLNGCFVTATMALWSTSWTEWKSLLANLAFLCCNGYGVGWEVDILCRHPTLAEHFHIQHPHSNSKRDDEKCTVEVIGVSSIPNPHLVKGKMTSNKNVQSMWHLHNLSFQATPLSVR